MATTPDRERPRKGGASQDARTGEYRVKTAKASGGTSTTFGSKILGVARGAMDPVPATTLVPNETTVEAMRAADRGEVIFVGRPSNLRSLVNED